MGWLFDFSRSSIGAKVVMAVTGVILVGFIFGHMAGNLQIYLGQDAFNDYAEFLKSKLALLWIVRVSLIIAAVLHIGSGMRLTALNRAARGPEKYRQKKNVKASFSGRTMARSGLLLFAFLIYHLLHFTGGYTHPEHFAQFETLPGGGTRHDVYTMFVMGFQQLEVSISYIIAVILLGLHLNHGIASMFQSIGVTSRRWAPWIGFVGAALAWLIVIGNISMPIAVLMGYVTLPGVS